METIAAIATAQSPSAIGIVRLSGEETRRVLAALFTPASGMAVEALPYRRMTYGDIRSVDGTLLDRGMAVCFSAAHSYTGEESAELHCHGSPVVLSEVLQAAFAAGARQARPGEFTQRAFLNGKLDLTEAEAVIDLIDAETAESARNAAAQLSGALRRPIERVYDKLLDVSSRFYAVVDYPDEDIEDLSREETERTLLCCEETLSDLLGTFARGKVLKNGVATAIIGAPNAGKSSLLNALVGFDRAIVTDIAGTTRDSVDTRFENKYGKYIFVDTAGIRRKSRVDDRIEKFSVMRAKLAIERADVCLIMIDARDGVTEQDTKIAGLAHEAGKASIIVVNKWDLVDKETGTMEKMRKDVLRDLSFMSYAPVLFISALTGQRTERLFELINFVNDQSAMRITTGMLNNVLADAQARVQPPTDKGRRLKIYYMTQTGVKPPCFVVFCNSRELFHFSYQRYLENQIRAVFGLEGTPIRMVIRQKGEQE